ncbi:hypothetical protein N7526_001743 [Penicillium atrosanguineum]|nr:hypothetical protein N7526_001743 [Penicillium atrosanguineum]
MTPLLEIACFNQESAINAANGGADRIELCRDYASGGLSPAATTLMELKSQITVPIYVMIRPHSNGFCYDKESFEIMKTTLSNMRNLGADGFVFGILNPLSGDSSKSLSSWIDVARNKELVKLAKGKPCTFHRAFDCIPESHWDTALDDLKGCGFASPTLPNGLIHSNLIPKKSCNPLQIIVGGAVRANNVQVLRETSHAQAFHSSALISSDETVATSEVESLRAMLRGNPLQRKSTP